MDLTDSLDNESSHCANNRPFKLIVSIAVKIIEVLKTSIFMLFGVYKSQRLTKTVLESAELMTFVALNC